MGYQQEYGMGEDVPARLDDGGAPWKCPIHGTAMHHHPFTGLDACQDPDCVLAKGAYYDALRGCWHYKIPEERRG